MKYRSFTLCLALTLMVISSGCAQANIHSETGSGESAGDEMLSSVAEPQPSSDFISEGSQAEDPQAEVSYLGVVERSAWAFTDGSTASEQLVMQIGDTFGPWTMEDMDVRVDAYSDGSEALVAITAEFAGTISLKGKVEILPEDELMGGIVSFHVAEESLHLLPYPVGDTRDVWLAFSNKDQAKEMLGIQEGVLQQCEVTINGYHIDFRPMMTWNTAELVEVHSAQ